MSELCSSLPRQFGHSMENQYVKPLVQGSHPKFNWRQWAVAVNGSLACSSEGRPSRSSTHGEALQLCNVNRSDRIQKVRHDNFMIEKMPFRTQVYSVPQEQLLKLHMSFLDSPVPIGFDVDKSNLRGRVARDLADEFVVATARVGVGGCKECVGRNSRPSGVDRRLAPAATRGQAFHVIASLMISP
jgi:hypothetical protein